MSVSGARAAILADLAGERAEYRMPIRVEWVSLWDMHKRLGVELSLFMCAWRQLWREGRVDWAEGKGKLL